MARQHSVTADEHDSRLDRWLKQYFTTYSHGQIEKLLRTGQVRVNSKRVKGNYRLVTDDQIRVPPIKDAVTVGLDVDNDTTKNFPKSYSISAEDKANFKNWILYEDDNLVAINKPAGLASQGGSKLTRHLDGMLMAMAEEDPTQPRLKLVHRLDKDTSGVLVLAKTTKMATLLGIGFRDRLVRKIYWGICAGAPKAPNGKIDYSLSKQRVGNEEKIVVDPQGERATSLYQVIDQAADIVSWLSLEPLTGRTHQLRVHLASLGIPLVGDYKYGGRQAFVPGIARLLHLHAYLLDLTKAVGYPLVIKASTLSTAMQTTFTQFDWQERQFYALYPEVQ